MDEERARHLRGLTRAVPAAFFIDRSTPPSGETDLLVRHIASHIEDVATKHLIELGDEADVKVSSHEAGAQRFGGFQTSHQLQRHLTELRLSELIRVKPLDFTVPNGSRVLGPPYDIDWNVDALPWARVDGEMILLGMPNFSACGVGLYLSSPTAALAAVTPAGTYDFSCVAFATYPFLRSRGGLGLTVYRGLDPTPVASRQALLWSLSGVTAFSGQRGSGLFANAPSSETSFGPILIAPILFNMEADVRYLVWIWCWQIGKWDPDTAFLALLSVHMNAVLINAGPPTFIG